MGSWDHLLVVPKLKSRIKRCISPKVCIKKGELVRDQLHIYTKLVLKGCCNIFFFYYPILAILKQTVSLDVM